MQRKFSGWYRYVLVAVLLAVAFLTTFGPQPNEETIAAVKLAAEHEFALRPDGLVGLQETYEFEFDAVYDMVIGLTHEALRASDVEAALGFATDGKIEQLDLVRLEDDQGFFSVHHAAPVIRAEVLEQYPVIEVALREVSSRLDNDSMVSLNYLVGIEEHEKRETAKTWLESQGLLEYVASLRLDSASEVVRVGANQFTEHQILGNVLLIVLETLNIPTVNHLHAPLFTLSREGIVAGELDLYWECSGAEWYHVYAEDESRVDGIEAVRLAAEYDAERGLVWLDHAPFTNSLAILMRSEHAEELAITTISDLARWAREVQASPER